MKRIAFALCPTGHEGKRIHWVTYLSIDCDVTFGCICARDHSTSAVKPSNNHSLGSEEKKEKHSVDFCSYSTFCSDEATKKSSNLMIYFSCCPYSPIPPLLYCDVALTEGSVIDSDTWMEGGTVTVKCLAQEHNKMGLTSSLGSS